MLSQSVFHFHVPKTAGTMLRRVAEDNLDGAEWQQSIADRELAFLLAGRARPPRLERFAFLSGHFPLALREMLKPPVVTICNIREPVDLVISYVAYQQTAGVIPADITLDQFLGSEAASMIINLQSRYLSSLEFPEFPREAAMFRQAASAELRQEMRRRFAGPEIEEAALSNAQTIDFVVDLADLHGGMQRLCAGLDWLLPPNLPLQNSGAYDKSGISQATRARIAELCDIDLRLYRHLQEKARAPRAREGRAHEHLPVICDNDHAFTLDASHHIAGCGWHMREFYPDWGWTRWTTHRSVAIVDLHLVGRMRYRLALLLIDIIEPAVLRHLTLDLGGMILRPQFEREGTAWRGHTEFQSPDNGLHVGEIAIEAPGARRPCDIGPGDDNRMLGVWMKSLVIAAIKSEK